MTQWSAIVVASFFAITLMARPAAPQTAQQLAVLNQIRQADPSVRIRWDNRTGAPARLAGKLSAPLEGDAREVCERFFSTNRALFSMSAPEQELAFLASRTDSRNWEHARLSQLYRNLPVEGSALAVHINANREVEIVTGRYFPGIEIDTGATVQAAAAIRTAELHLNPRTPITREPRAGLCVYHHRNQPHLAWKVRLFCENPLGDFVYYIDAKEGTILDRFNDLKYALNRKTYDARNGSSLPGLLARGEGDGPFGDEVLDAAHDHAGTVYQFYKNSYNRDSYDNAGATLISTVHYRTRFNNAFWDGTQMVYGDGDGNLFRPLSFGLDVVAHELTHAVTEHESNLIYRNQPGALNESLSDIFAALIDADDWYIGEEIFTPNKPGDALRYMDDPERGSQPAHMDDFVETDQDNGGVHINSGIPNKAAYLMADGGTFHGISVQGMGRENMGRVFYEAQIHWLHAAADFVDAREATLDAVRAVFPGDSAKEATVRRAWDAVGVKAPSPLTLTLSPSIVRVNSGGDSDRLTATLQSSGNPVAGATVAFASANPSTATVSPETTTTGIDGRATVTVTGRTRGNTTITATAGDSIDTAEASARVQVPVTSFAGLLLLLTIMAIAAMLALRRVQR